MQGQSWSVVLVYAFAACNAMPMSPSDPGDLDGDGIKDDPCIAPAADATGDFDHDGVANGDDPCPASYRPVGASESDSDGDGIPDVCDPFPMVAGDHYRCTMVFSDRALDTALWSPGARPGTTGFEYSGGPSETALASVYGSSPSPSFALATETLEAPETTTYDVAISARNFALYLRADPAPSDSDVACVLTELPVSAQ